MQTPTLALIVQRQKEITDFRPEDYWELKTLYRDTTFSATSGKFKNMEQAQAIVERIAAAPFTVTDITQKNGARGSSPPVRPHVASGGMQQELGMDRR